MKYYAVTEDPNELLHYGRLGMKWGQHIFVGPKSLAYKKAEGKLRKTVKSVKTAIKNTRAQHAINKQRRQENKFNKAVEKAQRRIAITENLHNLDALRRYEKADERAYKQEQRMLRSAEKRDRINDRMERKYARNERKMEKYTQEAREGRLRYGKLSEDQVDRIRNRLALENNARVLGGREKPSFRRRMKEAMQEGLLQGVTQGTAAGIREVAVAKVQNGLKNKRILDKQSRQEAQRSKEASRIKNKKTHKEMREDLNDRAYSAQIEAGENVFQRSKVLHPITNSNASKRIQKAEVYKNLHQQQIEQKSIAGKRLNELEDSARERKRLQEAETKRRNDIDARWQQYLSEGGSEYFIGKNDKTATDLRSDSSLAKKDRGKLYDEREKLLTSLGYGAESIKDRQNESKRIAETENKRRNDIDERYEKYIESGGQETFWEKDPKTGGQVEIDLRSNGKYKNDPSTLYKLREKYIRNAEKADEVKDKAAYDNYIQELQTNNITEQIRQGRKQQDAAYQAALQAWTKANGGGKNTSPKPKRSDFGTDADIQLLPLFNYPTYEEYKRRRKAGLPGLPGSNNGGGKGNKG